MSVDECRRNTWLFSGVSSGLGKEWALFLLERGDRIVGITRNADSVEQLTLKYGQQFIPVEADITDMGALEKALNSALNESSVHSISHVVCAAAFAHFVRLLSSKKTA